MNHDEIKNNNEPRSVTILDTLFHSLGIYTFTSEVLLEHMRNLPDCTGTGKGSADISHAAGFALEEADRVMSDIKRTIASIEPMPVIEMLTYINVPSREIWAQWIVEELTKLRIVEELAKLRKLEGESNDSE